jgi:hypothetical protein
MFSFFQHQKYSSTAEREKKQGKKSSGMMDESHQDFVQNYMEVTVQKISELIDQINECDIPFICKPIL